MEEYLLPSDGKIYTIFAFLLTYLYQVTFMLLSDKYVKTCFH